MYIVAKDETLPCVIKCERYLTAGGKLGKVTSFLLSISLFLLPPFGA